MFKMPVLYRSHSDAAYSMLTIAATTSQHAALSIWSRPGNPTRSVAGLLGITEHQLGDAIHIIKNAAGLRPGIVLYMG